MRRLPIIVIGAVAADLMMSCGGDDHNYVPNIIDGDNSPTMTTVDVNTYISDSGYTRYYITAPIWKMYEDAKEPHWKFPDGLELEQYDRDLQVTANMICDSATYFSQKRLWRLDGNVVMVNPQRDSFLTQQVYWDQAKREVYSDSFVHIVRSDRIIEGYGFTSNEPMTAYTVNRPTGIFPAKRKEEAAPASAEPTDSDSIATPRRSTRRQPSPARTTSAAKPLTTEPAKDSAAKPLTTEPANPETETETQN